VTMPLPLPWNSLCLPNVVATERQYNNQEVIPPCLALFEHQQLSR
jgi:hypothetical protein